MKTRYPSPPGVWYSAGVCDFIRAWDISDIIHCGIFNDKQHMQNIGSNMAVTSGIRC